MMAWCQNCNKEYEKGVEVCEECGSTLIEKPEDMEVLEEIEKQERGIELIQEGGNTYVKKADKYNDFYSSGIMLVVFGVFGLLYNVLAQFKVTPLEYSLPAVVILSLLFCLFIGFGIRSLMQASRLKKQIGDEEIRIDEIKAFLQEKVTPETIKEWEKSEQSPEENYLDAVERIQKMVLEFVGEPLEEAFLESVIEEYYSEYLDEE